MKINIATSLQVSALGLYTSKLSDFDRNALNNNLSMKSWDNTLAYCFKIPTSVAFDLLTNETYSLDDTQA